jgi:hypothetical protein
MPSSREFCIPASRILAVKLNRNTRGMPAFSTTLSPLEHRANTGVCSTPPSGVHASPVSTQPYALWRRRPERRRRPDDTLSGGATSSAARTDAPQYGIRPSIRAIRLGACDDLLPHLTAQREADVHVELGVNQCVECGIACVGSHGLQSLRINGVQVRHHRG